MSNKYTQHTILRGSEKPDAGLAGRYRFVVRSAITGHVVRETDWFDNIILTTGLNRLGAGSWLGYAHIGTGVTTPAIGDTTLAALAATTTTVGPGSQANSNSGSPLYISSQLVVYRFNAGVLNGNYTEVGIGWTATDLFSRALILDGGGSPTSISVGPTEFLDVYYELRIVPVLTDVVTAVTIGGVGYNVTRRPAYVSSTVYWKAIQDRAWGWAQGTSGVFQYMTGFSGAIGAVTGAPSGTAGAFPNVASMSAYVSNSFERTGTISAGLGDGNVPGGIKSLIVYNAMCAYQYEFDVVVPKDNTKVMTLTGKVTWGRL